MTRGKAKGDETKKPQDDESCGFVVSIQRCRSDGCRLYLLPRIASLAALAMRNLTFLRLGTLTVWPALGPKRMTISRAGLSASTSLPIPGITNVFLACL